MNGREKKWNREKTGSVQIVNSDDVDEYIWWLFRTRIKKINWLRKMKVISIIVSSLLKLRCRFTLLFKFKRNIINIEEKWKQRRFKKIQDYFFIKERWKKF